MEIQQLDKYFNVIHKCLSNEDFLKICNFNFSRSNSLRLKNKYKLSVGKYDLIEIPIIRLKKYFQKK